MALSQETTVTDITVLRDNKIKVSTSLIVKDGEDIIADKEDYYLLVEGDDISQESDRVKNIINTVWD